MSVKFVPDEDHPWHGSYVDDYDHPHISDSVMHNLHEAISRVRDSIGVSMGTISSLSDASLERLYQNLESAALLVMAQADALRKAMDKRLRNGQLGLPGIE